MKSKFKKKGNGKKSLINVFSILLVNSGLESCGLIPLSPVSKGKTHQLP